MGKDTLVSITMRSIQECPYPYGLGKNCGFFTWALRFQNCLSYKITTLSTSKDNQKFPFKCYELTNNILFNSDWSRRQELDY